MKEIQRDIKVNDSQFILNFRDKRWHYESHKSQPTKKATLTLLGPLLCIL